MIYNYAQELPREVRDSLPPRAQEIFQNAYNSAWIQYKEPRTLDKKEGEREELSRWVAWNAVKEEYVKNDGSWQLKSDIGLVL